MPSGNYATIGQLDKKWSQVRHDIFELLNKLPDEDYKKEIWKHAIAGKMNAYQMLSFFNIHFNRHRKQIYRTMAENVL
jgi:DinB superfamily